jgi:hypothetical protein
MFATLRGSVLVLLFLPCVAACASAPESPLIPGVLRGDAAAVEAGLAQGQDPNARDGSRRTALMWAAGAPRSGVEVLGSGRMRSIRVEGRVDMPMIRLLLDHGADPDLVDDHGESALSFAAASGHLEAVSALVDAGARVDVGRDRGCAPILLAASEGHAPVVERLLAAGADPNVADPHGQTALMTAAFGAVDEGGNTALCQAAYEGQAEALSVLLAAGASLDHRSKAGKTALEIAMERGKDEAAALLRASGSEP